MIRILQPRPKRPVTPPLRWKRTAEDDGTTSWWANRGQLCFAIYYCPPEAGQRKATVELSSWTGDCEEQTVRHEERYAGTLNDFLHELHVHQRTVIRETAEVLEAKTAAVRALLSA